jgi:hypothetical protein
VSSYSVHTCGSFSHPSSFFYISCYRPRFCSTLLYYATDESLRIAEGLFASRLIVYVGNGVVCRQKHGPWKGRLSTKIWLALLKLLMLQDAMAWTQLLSSVQVFFIQGLKDCRPLWQPDLPSLHKIGNDIHLIENVWRDSL